MLKSVGGINYLDTFLYWLRVSRPHCKIDMIGKSSSLSSYSNKVACWVTWPQIFFKKEYDLYITFDHHLIPCNSAKKVILLHDMHLVSAKFDSLMSLRSRIRIKVLRLELRFNIFFRRADIAVQTQELGRVISRSRSPIVPKYEFSNVNDVIVSRAQRFAQKSTCAPFLRIDALIVTSLAPHRCNHRITDALEKIRSINNSQQINVCVVGISEKALPASYCESLEYQLTFMPSLEHESLLKLMLASDRLIALSTFETLFLPFYEARGLGLECLCLSSTDRFPKWVKRL